MRISRIFFAADVLECPIDLMVSLGCRKRRKTVEQYQLVVLAFRYQEFSIQGLPLR